MQLHRSPGQFHFFQAARVIVFSDTRLDMPQFTRDEIRWAHQHFQSFRPRYWLTGRLPERLRRSLDPKLDRRWLEGGHRARARSVA